MSVEIIETDQGPRTVCGIGGQDSAESSAAKKRLASLTGAGLAAFLAAAAVIARIKKK